MERSCLGPDHPIPDRHLAPEEAHNKVADRVMAPAPGPDKVPVLDEVLDEAPGAALDPALSAISAPLLIKPVIAMHAI